MSKNLKSKEASSNDQNELRHLVQQIKNQKISLNSNKIEQLSTDELALIFNVLPRDFTRTIFENLSDVNVVKILAKMQERQHAPISEVNTALKKFYDLLTEEHSYCFENNSSPSFVRQVLSPEREKHLFGKAGYQNPIKYLEILEMIDDQILMQFLLRIHPQMATLILSLIPSFRRGQLLKNLPLDLQAELIRRMASLDVVENKILQELDEKIRQEISMMGRSQKITKGGSKEVAQMLQKMPYEEQKHLLERIETHHKNIAQEIKEHLFTFENIADLTDSTLRILLQKIPESEWIMALKLDSSPLLSRLLKNMSERSRRQFQENRQSILPQKKSVVLEAQVKIIEKIKSLESSGIIQLTKVTDEPMV